MFCESPARNRLLRANVAFSQIRDCKRRYCAVAEVGHLELRRVNVPFIGSERPRFTAGALCISGQVAEPVVGGRFAPSPRISLARSDRCRLGENTGTGLPRRARGTVAEKVVMSYVFGLSLQPRMAVGLPALAAVARKCRLIACHPGARSDVVAALEVGREVRCAGAVHP